MLRTGEPVTDEVALQMHVDPEVWEMMKDLTFETFGQEIEALFTEFAGRVFKEFDEEIHVADLDYNPGWETYAAVDHGTTNPFVWLLLQIDPLDGTTHVLREIHQPGLDIEEAVQMVIDRGLCPDGLRKFYPDPANPGDNRYMSKKLKIRAIGGTGGPIDIRLRLIRQALKVRNVHLPLEDPDRKPRILFDRKGCPETIREMIDYRYPKTVEEAKLLASNAPEKPLKKDDHSPEALGRYFLGRWGSPGPARTRVTSGEVAADPTYSGMRRGRQTAEPLPAWAGR
jgi:hypothetical protein